MAKPTDEDLTRRSRLFSAFTGRPGDPASGTTNSVRDMLHTAYGTQRNGEAAVDTRQAAKSLGVSQRTVQRWLKQTNAPSTDHLKKIRNRARQSATTKRGRARVMKAAMAQQPEFAQQGTTVKVVGHQGPYGYERDKQRASFQRLSPDEYQQMIAAYVDSGDDGAIAYLQAIYDRDYVDDWRFASIAQIEFRPGNSRGNDPRA